MCCFMLASKTCLGEGFSVGCRGGRLDGYVQQPWGVGFLDTLLRTNMSHLEKGTSASKDSKVPFWGICSFQRGYFWARSSCQNYIVAKCTCDRSLGKNFVLCFWFSWVVAIFTSQSQTFSTSPSTMGHHGIGHLHFFWLVATCSGATEPLMKFGKLRI